MNKLELIQALKQKTDLSKHDAKEVVEIFFDSMIDAFVKGERVEIRGFCSFFIKEYDGYTGRNPKTGEKVQILANRHQVYQEARLKHPERWSGKTRNWESDAEVVLKKFKRLKAEDTVYKDAA